MGITALSLALLSVLDADTSVAYLVWTLMLGGIGFALFTAPNANALMSAVAPRHYGSATGSMGTLRVLGQMLSMAIVTLLFALLLGPVQIAPEHHTALIRSIEWALLISAGLCMLGIYFSLASGAKQSVAVTS